MNWNICQKVPLSSLNDCTRGLSGTLGIFKVEIILVPKKGCFWLKNANFRHFPKIVNAAFCITVCYREIVQKNKFQSRIRSEVNVMKDFLMPIFLVSALIHTQKYTFRKTLRYPLVSYLIGKNTFSPSLKPPPFLGVFGVFFSLLRHCESLFFLTWSLMKLIFWSFFHEFFRKMGGVPD